MYFERLRIPFPTLVAISLLLFFLDDGAAQDGPIVPCQGVGCEASALYVPYPETGSWYNPEQSGTGLTIEIQNGFLLAYYFGYNAEGNPEWLMLSGKLERSSTSGVLWELSPEPLRVSGGNCLGCRYKAPESFEPQPVIKLEFLQRAYARVTPQGGSPQFFVPLNFGDSAFAFFEDITPYKFPNLTEDPYSSYWVIMIKEYGEEEHEPYLWFGGFAQIRHAILAGGGPWVGKLLYEIYIPGNPPELGQPFGQIVCGPGESGPELGCILYAGIPDAREFHLPIGNFTDSRILAESEDGWRLEGFRIQYD
jgi:hypothetical protein